MTTELSPAVVYASPSPGVKADIENFQDECHVTESETTKTVEAVVVMDETVDETKKVTQSGSSGSSCCCCCCSSRIMCYLIPLVVLVLVLGVGLGVGLQENNRLSTSSSSATSTSSSSSSDSEDDSEDTSSPPPPSSSIDLSNLSYTLNSNHTHVNAPAGSLFWHGNGAWDQIGVIDGNTGCLSVSRASQQHLTFVPLCRDEFLLTGGLHIHHGDAIVRIQRDDDGGDNDQGSQVEIWRETWNADKKAYEFLELPEGNNTLNATTVLRNGDATEVVTLTGFGKQIYSFGDKILVSSDTTVAIFDKYEKQTVLHTGTTSTYTHEQGWRNISFFENTRGFSVDPEETVIAIYGSTFLHLLDLEVRRWAWSQHYTPESIQNIPSVGSILSATASDAGRTVHVVSKDDDGDGDRTIITEVRSGHVVATVLDPCLVLGDYLYNTLTGDVMDVRSATYLNIHVPPNGNIRSIQVDGPRVMIVVERDGISMVEVYENKAQA